MRITKRMLYNRLEQIQEIQNGHTLKIQELIQKASPSIPEDEWELLKHFFITEGRQRELLRLLKY